MRKPKQAGGDPSPQRHLEAALASVTDCAVTADARNRVLFMNAAAEALTGRRLRTAAGTYLGEVLPLVDTKTGAAIVDAVAEAISAPKNSVDGPPRWRRAVLERESQQSLIIQYAVTALREPNGALAGSVSILRDVTHHGFEAGDPAMLLADTIAPLDEKERAQVTLDSIANGVISANFRGRVTFLNHIAEQITGWTSADARGHAIDDILRLVDPQSRDAIASPGMRAIIEGRTVALEMPAVLIRRDGQELDVEHSASPIRDKSGAVIGTVLVVHDVTMLREQAQKLAQLALYDSLTGLPNRTLLMERLERALERARRNSTKVALLFVDLDRFKPVNDSLGHAVGDQLLSLVGQRLLSCVRRSDTVSRLGGDEFVIMMEDIRRASEATRCAVKLDVAMGTPFNVQGSILSLGASIGVATFPDDAQDGAALLRHADKAMYQVKSSGRTKPEMGGLASRRGEQGDRREAARARR